MRLIQSSSVLFLRPIAFDELLMTISSAKTVVSQQATLLCKVRMRPYFVMVAVSGIDKIIGFVSLHFIPQLGAEGDFCRTSYFCVD